MSSSQELGMGCLANVSNKQKHQLQSMFNKYPVNAEHINHPKIKDKKAMQQNKRLLAKQAMSLLQLRFASANQ
jgi:hypothetical protein